MTEKREMSAYDGNRKNKLCKFRLPSTLEPWTGEFSTERIKRCRKNATYDLTLSNFKCSIFDSGLEITTVMTRAVTFTLTGTHILFSIHKFFCFMIIQCI